MIKKILLVDDSPISRRIMKSCLPKDRDYEIFEAGDGLAGLEAYKQHAPDVTFMDLTMPVMDGTQATEEIVKYDKDAIVIVCTADIQIKSLTNVLGVGAFMIVKKPPSKETVEDALAKAEAQIG